MHKGERRAFAVLLSLCFIAAAWVTWEQWLRPRVLPDKAKIEVAWRALQQDTAHGKHYARRERKPLRLFPFDPNGLPLEQWVELGLSKKQAAVIHRYEERGGQFRAKADLAKMYVVDEELYTQWEPYIQLPDERPKRKWKKRWANERPSDDTATWKRKGRRNYPARDPKRVVQVELNSADSATLVAVRGIGPAFARSIIKYRELLGGYVSLDQLSEVYILRDKPDAVDRIKEQLTLDTALVERIPLNRCTAEELANHPYARWKLAKALMAYRQHHGPFPNVDAIAGCALITDSIQARLGPYLEVLP